MAYIEEPRVGELTLRKKVQNRQRPEGLEQRKAHPLAHGTS